MYQLYPLRLESGFRKSKYFSLIVPPNPLRFTAWVSEGLLRLNQLEELLLRICEGVVNSFDNESLKNSKKRKHSHFSLSNTSNSVQNHTEGTGWFGEVQNESKIPHRESDRDKGTADVFRQQFKGEAPKFHFEFEPKTAQNDLKQSPFESTANHLQQQYPQERPDEFPMEQPGAQPPLSYSTDMMVESQPIPMAAPRIHKNSLGSSYSASIPEFKEPDEIMSEDVVARLQDAPFQAQLSRAGLVYKPVKSDGNMQFRVLADQVYGTESAHSIVRLLVVSEIIQNPSVYERHLPTQSIDFQEYCAIMSREGCCGDHLTLNAFANFYGADVLVYSPTFTHPMLIQSKRTLGKIAEPMRIAHRGENDWQSLVFPQTELLRARTNSNNANAKRPASSEALDGRSSKRAKTGEHRGMEIEEHQKQFTRNYGKLGPLSLVNLCLEKVVEKIDSCPPLQGKLPVDILYAIIESCARRKKLSDAICARLIDPTMTSIRLKDFNGSITDLTLSDIAKKCHQLQYLELLNCVNVTNRGIEQIASNCPNLEHLILRSCSGVGNSAIQEVARKCPRLISINLNGCVQVTDIALQELELACPNLTNVALCDCNQLTDSALHYVGKNTMALDMSNCEEISDKSLFSISKRCPNLRMLKLLGHNLSDIGIVSLAKGCKDLSILELSNCSNVHNAAVHTLGRNCPRLEVLNLKSCRSIDDDAFDFQIDVNAEETTTTTTTKSKKPKIFSILRSLNLSRCTKVGDLGLSKLVTNCLSLQSLVLDSCQDITDISIINIANYCPNLVEIDLSNCNRITGMNSVLII